MPALTEANVRHLLRRTEVVDRPFRVAELMGLADMEAAVDDVMDIAPSPAPVSYSGVSDVEWRRGIRYCEHWMGQMANAPRPFGERMAFFWHGHITSSADKVGWDQMLPQMDLFRQQGLGSDGYSANFASLIKTASIQPTMIRYLDNEKNRASSPNQNFARELIELFVLGVGNYTEADVEAATAAWTGHTKTWDTHQYRFRPEHHENAPQTFLGRTINQGEASEAGNETIDVMLGTGAIGAGTIYVGANAGRSAPEVTAEFLSKKLWQEFGEAESGRVPSGVLSEMTAALLNGDFDIRPWVRAMLLHDDFYTSATKNGLMRQPVDLVVALLVATGIPAYDNGRTPIPFWSMRDAGQQLLFPPNVSGWKPNGYWINPSSMDARNAIADAMMWQQRRYTYSGSGGYLEFGNGERITKNEVETLPVTQLVDRFIELCQLQPLASTRQRIIDHLNDPTIAGWMRSDALQLLLTAPEMHTA